MKGYIYLIENKINGKKYIGKTYHSIDKRWEEHKQDCRFKNSENRPLYKAMDFYGIENFTIKELEFTENCEEQEKYWISFYDTFNSGYNATLGGDGRPYFNYSDEEVISKYDELKSITGVAEYFNCDKDTIRVRLINNGIKLTGGIYSEKHGQWTAKKVCQYNDDNKLLNKFDSFSKAAEWIVNNNYSTATIKSIAYNISKNTRGKENRKHAYGFIWKLFDNNMEV